MTIVDINISEMIAKKYAEAVGPRVDGDELLFDFFSLGFYCGFGEGIFAVSKIVTETVNDKQLSIDFIIHE